MTQSGTCLVVGAGEGLGAAVARGFARTGLAVHLTRRPRNLATLETLAQSIRDEGGAATAHGVDAREEASMTALVEAVEAQGPLEVLVFNIGANVRYPVVDTTSRVYSKVWEMAAFSGFLAVREASRVMAPRGRGTILITGATASLRGREGFSAFAGAKAALRALAQSAARELGPKGVHVAHIVCDGAIDGAFTRERIADLDARMARDEILRPEEIAKTYVWLHGQNRSAWTHELDLRPWTEPW